MSVQGKFVWHDLNSNDVDKAKGFYGALFGWQFKQDGQRPYHLIERPGQHHFGGLFALDQAHQVPTHWSPYIAVDNIDAAIAAVAAGGGKLLLPKNDLGEIGAFAIALDPQGGVFVPFQYGSRGPRPDTDAPPPPGEFCWDELWTSDPDAAVAFYGKVAHLGVEHVEMPDFGRYTLFLRDAVGADGKRRQAAGMAKLTPGMPAHTYWLSYVAVADTDATAAEAPKLGGTVITPPMNIPNVGRFSVMLDAEGCAFAILGPNR